MRLSRVPQKAVSPAPLNSARLSPTIFETKNAPPRWQPCCLRDGAYSLRACEKKHIFSNGRAGITASSRLLFNGDAGRTPALARLPQLPWKGAERPACHRGAACGSRELNDSTETSGANGGELPRRWRLRKRKPFLCKQGTAPSSILCFAFCSPLFHAPGVTGSSAGRWSP